MIVWFQGPMRKVYAPHDRMMHPAAWRKRCKTTKNAVDRGGLIFVSTIHYFFPVIEMTPPRNGAGIPFVWKSYTARAARPFDLH